MNSPYPRNHETKRTIESPERKQLTHPRFMNRSVLKFLVRIRPTIYKSSVNRRIRIHIRQDSQDSLRPSKLPNIIVNQSYFHLNTSSTSSSHLSLGNLFTKLLNFNSSKIAITFSRL